MARAKYSPYFTKADGALGPQGSGFRRVQAKIGPKWVFVKFAFGSRSKISRSTWDNDVKKVPDEGQPMGEILASFKQGETCEKPNSVLKGSGRRQTRARSRS